MKCPECGVVVPERTLFLRCECGYDFRGPPVVRPWPVWAISAYVTYCAVGVLVLMFSVYTGEAPAGMTVSIRSMEPLIFAATAMFMIVDIAAAGFLFKLKRTAVPLFAASFCWAIIGTIHSLGQPMYFEMMKKMLFIPLVIAIGLKLTFWAYSYRLLQRGILK